MANMTYDELIRIIVESDVTDWNPIESSEGPYTMFACYRNNVSISLAFGLTINNDFCEEWVSGFAECRASSEYLDFFYNNSLVQRFMYVVIDGRAYLPLPESSDRLIVSETESRIIRLIHSIAFDGNTYDDYFRRSGFSIEN